MSKICPICGTEFEPNSHTRKYCSDECSKIANRRNATKWYQDRKLKKQIAECSSKHNNCFNCPTENGDCLYE